MLNPIFDDDINHTITEIMTDYPHAPFVIIFIGLSVALFSVMYSYSFDIKRRF